MAKQSPLKQKSRYFEQQQQKGGENFLGMKKASEFTKEMPRILCEFVNYNIDIDKYGYIFTSKKFIEGCEAYCISQLNLLLMMQRNFNAYFYLNAMNQIPCSEYDTSTFNFISKKIEAYDMIYKTLQVVRNTCSYQPMIRLQVDLNKNYRQYLQRGSEI